MHFTGVWVSFNEGDTVIPLEQVFYLRSIFVRGIFSLFEVFSLFRGVRSDFEVFSLFLNCFSVLCSSVFCRSKKQKIEKHLVFSYFLQIT